MQSTQPRVPPVSHGPEYALVNINAKLSTKLLSCAADPPAGNDQRSLAPPYVEFSKTPIGQLLVFKFADRLPSVKFM
jgi:hypothetical protein